MRVHPALLALAALAAACGDTIEVPPVGTINLTVSTTGGDPDLDGYVVLVDGEVWNTVQSSAELDISGLPAGPHDLELTGVAENCTVDGGASRAVTVAAGDTSAVEYPVACLATGVHVVASTTGVDQDPNGYRLSVDDGPSVAMDPSAIAIVTRLTQGTHTVALTDLAANCAVSGDNPSTVTVPLGEVVLVSFAVTCGAIKGAIEVTAATSGIDVPTGGYTVDVASREPIGPNGTVLYEQLDPGDYTVRLNGLPANCTVAGDNPRTVTVSAGGATRDTARTTFQVGCVAVTGVLTISAATAGIDLPDSNAYSVRVDQSAPQPLGLNGTFTREQLAPGDYTVTLEGVPANCALTGDNPRTVTVTAGGTTRDTTRATFELTCVAVTGAVQIVVATSGTDFDLDGYFVRLGVEDAVAVAVNDTITTTSIAPGDHVVALERLASNCTVAGANPQTVAVTAGGITRDTARTTFGVTCTATGRIAYTNSGLLMVGNDDGSSQMTITDGNDPTWSPDGTRLAFHRPGYCDYYSYTCYDGGIFAINLDGTGVARLTTESPDRDAAWRPDGTRIAFARFTDGQYALYLMSASGSGLTRLTPTTGIISAEAPSWSPDGSALAFTCQIVSGNLDLCVINADGTGLTRITTDTARDARPAWSPDGTRIAFSTTIFSGTHELALIAPDGSGLTRVSPETGALQPAWSPDGARIGFTAFRCDPYSGCMTPGLFSIRPDGTDRTQLTTGEDYGAAWRP
jgi:TolB protein